MIWTKVWWNMGVYLVSLQHLHYMSSEGKLKRCTMGSLRWSWYPGRNEDKNQNTSVGIRISNAGKSLKNWQKYLRRRTAWYDVKWHLLYYIELVILPRAMVRVTQFCILPFSMQEGQKRRSGIMETAVRCCGNITTIFFFSVTPRGLTWVRDYSL